jgi:hypothetical protein
MLPEPHVAAPAGTLGASVPGQSASGERTIDAARLARATGASSPQVDAALPRPPPAIDPLTSPPPVTASYSGTITGRIYDYTYGVPITNATIQAEPFGSTSCLPGLCTETESGTNGVFSLPAIVGAVSLFFTAPAYVGNQTWADLGRGQTVDLGFVFLLHDGYATGTVEAATPGHPTLANIEVNSTSRVGDLSGDPGEVTGPSGTFDIAVPPVPSEVTVTPLAASSPYLFNTTYANVTSYGTVDLGVIYLEGGVLVSAELIDRSTDRPVANGTPSQLTFCTEPAGVCTFPILNQTGANVTAWGLPGTAEVTAAAIGYVVNTTAVEPIPNANGTVDLGLIYLVPLAAAEISTNFTGGTAPGGGWPAGNVTAYVCSLDSVEVAVQLVIGGELLGAPCWPRGLPGAAVGNTYAVGGTAIVLGPPLRDAVMIVPSNASPPSFPIAEASSLSPSPEYPATYANITWANLTPDAVTVLGSVDVEGGDYLSGNVTEPGAAGSLDGQFTVQVCSTDTAGVCGASVLSSDLEPAVVGCPSGASEFCAPAPPGPDTITVTEVGPGTTNVSWIQVPAGCCAQSGSPIAVGTIGLPAVSAYGVIDGIVDARTAGWGSAANAPGDVFGFLQACPVGPQPLWAGSPSCTYGVLNSTTGSFTMVAPSGWDKVTASASGYQQNWTWLFVNGTNFSGIIELTPNGYLTGTVDSAAGGPVAGAVISTCPIGTPNSCNVVASAGTDGRYNASVAGGSFPWATYIVEASYPGFVTDWTWVNASAGSIALVPTLVLPVLSTPNATSGSNASARPLWVTGTVIDTRTGLPVRLADIGQCEDYSCGNGAEFATYGGTFNLTWIAGEDQLLVSAAGYDAEYVSVPSTSNESLSLGEVPLRPFGWVSGQVLIGPWGSLAGSDGQGAPVQVQFCPGPDQPGFCGSPTQTNTAGYFNASADSGAMLLMTGGGGIQAFGTAQGGFEYLETPEFIPASNFSSIGNVSDPLFLGVAGQMVDGTGSGGFLNDSGRSGFVDVEATPGAAALTPYNWTFAITGPDGQYTFFLGLPTGSPVTLTAAAIGYRTYQTSVVLTTPAPGITPVAGAEMSHDGYLTATAVDAVTSAPVPDASIVASVVDPANFTTFSLGAAANGSGEVNTTAPSGLAVSVTVSAPGYFPRAFLEPITSGRTTALGPVALMEGAPPSGFFVQSEYINTAGLPAIPTVVDPKTGAPLPDAEIAIAVSNGSVVGTTFTNDLGQFLLWVPTSPFIDLTLTLSAYDPVTIYYSTAGDTHLSLRYVNTTGTGIVAGRVILDPNGTGVYDTEVNVCPTGASGGICFMLDEAVGYTNVSGDFWVPSTRGIDTVSINTEQYLANQTLNLGVSTDEFYEVGTMDVYAFATISGVVLGVPGGQPIAGANVSLCSPFGDPYGPCDTSTVTGAGGNFSFQSPPSTYVLVATALGYNETYRSILLGPGQQLDIGALLLLADGVVTGRAVSSFNGAPVANTTLIVCLLDAPADCTPFLQGNPDGTFALEAPPGPDVLTLSAPGYFSNYTDLVVPSGGAIDLGNVGLQPLAIDIPESVAGSILSANRSEAPIAGAFVSLDIGTQPVTSTLSDAMGGFRLPVTWGSYTLVVSATGYVGVRLPLIVHTNVTGFNVDLLTRAFLVAGTVRDATTEAALPSVTVAWNNTTLGVTNSVGAFGFYLPNGSYQLEADSAGIGGISYSPLEFLVRVDGGSVVHNISLAEATARLVGVVVDASSGLPIPGASLSLSGGGLPKALSTVAGVTGAFAFSLAPGSYLLNGSAPGYSAGSIDVVVPSTGAVDLALAASLRASSSAGPISALDLIVVGAAVAAVALAVLLVQRRRPPPPPEPPKWTLEEPEG